MTNTRQNVWELGKDWADPILWYARGVAALRARPLADGTSWRFYAAIHGIDQALWKSLGYFSASDKKPTAAVVKRFWNQCQHGTWYFLPWHRGYLLAFEATVRDAVVALGGPTDWALPYWNYFKPNQAALPPAFASPDWPDGTGNNPLFIPQRYGPQNDGNVVVLLDQVNLKAMQDADFSGSGSGGSPGFGGVDTGFAHSGSRHGGIESQPHDVVHGLVGGGDVSNPGLMSDPDTAALDPIFWLHHANIDRLWEVWNQSSPAHADPTEAKWLKGPASIGERAFILPMPGNKTLKYAPADMTDLNKLGYTYDDLGPAAAGVVAGGPRMSKGERVELVGASHGPVRVSGAEARSSVKLDSTVRQKVSANLGAAAAAVPERVFLNLENVRGLSDATTFKVYVGLAEDARPKDHPELLAGTVSLFGARKASLADGEHAGKGLTFVLDITSVVDALHLKRGFDVDDLGVRIIPVRPVAEAAQVSIGRVSVFRQGK